MRSHAGFFVTFALLLACGAESPKGGPSPVPVVTTLVRGGELSIPLTLRGELVSPDAATVATEVAGVVVAVPARVGQRVAAGELLVALDNEAAKIGERLGEARLSQAEAAVEARRAAADKVRSGRDRLLLVHQSRPESVAARELEEIELVLAEAHAALKVAEADVLARRAERDVARLERRRTVLLAPTAGVVMVQSARVGDRVSPGEALVQLSGAGPLEAILEAGERQIGRIEAGTSLRLSIPSRPDLGTAETVVAGVAPAADGPGRVQWLRAELPDPPPGWVAGFAIDGEAGLKSGDEQVVVPRDALIRGVVFVVADGKAREVKVEVRGEAGADVVVRGELAGGESVVIRGNEALADGMPVAENPI